MARKRHPLFTPVDIDNLKWFWHGYLKQNAIWLAFVFGLVSLQGLVYQQFLALTENGLRVIFEDGSVTDLLWACGLVFVLFSIRAFLSYVVPRLSAWLAAAAVEKLRFEMIDKLMTLDLAWYERTKVGDIILRMLMQADGLSQFVGQATVRAVRDFMTVIFVSAWLIWKSPILFTAALISIPPIIFIMQLVSHRIKEIQAKSENAFGDYMSAIEETANGIRTVKISAQEPRERDRLRKATSGIRTISINLQAAMALTAPSIDLVSAFVYALVIGGGGYMVLNGTGGMDAAGIIAFLLGLVILFDPARLLASFFSRLQASLILLAGVREIFQTYPTITDAPGATTKFDPKGDLVFEGARFAYEGAPDQPVFDDLDMVIKGGQTTAIVGATGSGKTTILSLITRLYDLDKGTVRIGGHNLRDLQIRALRQSFSVVAQDIVIFNASIWDNIKYVRPDASEDEIWAAAEAAQIADLMRTRGDEPLGPNGAQLSGGQKQRIAIARAILGSAPILLLDEATSALDQKTETLVQKALGDLGADKTTIIVSHRLSAVVNADWIYVLDFGKIVAQGTHGSLMAEGGLYASMYQSQKDGYT